jgi:hypothetical protein
MHIHKTGQHKLNKKASQSVHHPDVHYLITWQIFNAHGAWTQQGVRSEGMDGVAAAIIPRPTREIMFEQP